MSSDPTDSALVSVAELWLSQGFDGIGNAGDVYGAKIRYYEGDTFSHQFDGYEAARTRLGRDHGEAFAEAPADKHGLVGIVGERAHAGTPSLVCEVFDLASGRSVLAVQPFRKTLFKRKRVGPVAIIGPAEPLPFTPTPPALKALVARLRILADERIAAHREPTSAAEIDMQSWFTERGGDGVLWDFNLEPHRDGRILKIWSKPIWAGQTALLSEDEFCNWLDETLGVAIAL